MFWKGKVSFITHLQRYLSKSDLTLESLDKPSVSNLTGSCEIGISKFSDSKGISDLLNEWFEGSPRVRVNTTPEWIRSTCLDSHAIWIVAKDSRGTIRGCVSSFISEGPYPNSISGCNKISWGIVDWFCVHPLWRSKGIGSSLLETLDLITYRIGRKAHIFLKEGIPLPLPHIPIYFTWLKCRKAGNPSIKQINEDNGLVVYSYREVERSTNIPLLRVEGITNHIGLDKWEEALDNLPECWVFVSGNCITRDEKGWKTDSLVSMYAFRWSPGKWLGSYPRQSII
jgi:GNAT superfamily N-acetyltransferase